MGDQRLTKSGTRRTPATTRSGRCSVRWRSGWRCARSTGSAASTGCSTSLAAALAAYVYYLELFVVVALNLYVLVTRWRDRRLLLRWFGAQIALGLILAPWYLQPRLLFGSGYGGTTGNFDPLAVVHALPARALTFGDTETLPPAFVAWLAPLLVIALLPG